MSEIVKNTDYFFILDFDRTLVDSDRLAMRIYEVVERATGLRSEDIILKQRELEGLSDTGKGIVDMWNIIEQCFPNGTNLPELHSKIIAMISSRRDELWLAGAKRLLNGLHTAGTSYCILTTGSMEWQSLKIACMGLNAQAVRVIATHDKTSVIRSMINDEGMFIIPEDLSKSKQMIVRRIIQIDDRSRALSGEIPGVEGYWVKTGRDDTESPLKVTIAFSSLTEVVYHLKAKKYLKL